MDVLVTIKDILSENIGIDPKQVSEDSTFDSLNVDSLDMVELIVELEDRCDIDFGAPEGLTTVGELITYVESL